MQLVGFDEQVMKELLKHMSVNLCPNTLGQVLHVHLYITFFLAERRTCRPFMWLHAEK